MWSRVISAIERRSRLSLRTHLPSTLWLFGGQMIGSVGSLVLTVLLANSLSENDFGTYKYLLTIFGFISVIALTGFATSVTRSVARGYEGELQAGIKTSLRYSFGMVALGLGISGYYLWQGNLVIGLGSLVATLTAPLINALPLYTALINGRHDHKNYSIVGILINVVPVLASLITLYFTTAILTLFAVYMVSQVVLHIVLYYVVTNHYKPNNKRDHQSTTYGKHLSLMNILGGVSYQLDKVVIWHVLGPVQLAIYTIAIAPAQQLRYLNKILTTITLPRFSQRSLTHLQSTMMPKLLALLIVSIGIVLAYVAVAPFLFSYFVPGYTEAIIYSQVFAFLILFFPAGLLQEAIKAHADTKALYIIQTVIPGLKIILLLVLTPLFGIFGVLAAMFICEITRLFIVLWYFYRPLSGTGVKAEQHA
ncbi:MAG: oligosaccharide flippase family protein [Candidatus Paceibacteria bacterium]